MPRLELENVTKLYGGEGAPVKALDDISFQAEPGAEPSSDVDALKSHSAKAQKAVTEGMGSIIDRTQEQLGPSDVGIIQVRRMLIQAATALKP